jgi:hypothetical protein
METQLVPHKNHFSGSKKKVPFKVFTTLHTAPARHMVLSLRGILGKLYCGICEITSVHAPSVHEQHHFSVPATNKISSPQGVTCYLYMFECTN